MECTGILKTWTSRRYKFKTRAWVKEGNHEAQNALENFENLRVECCDRVGSDLNGV